VTPRALLDACSGLLGEVLRFDAPADNAVSAFFRQHRLLGARERHTLAETVYEVLRRRLLYQHLAQGAPKDGARPERRLAMLGWAGDAAFLKAALSEAEQGWLAQARAVDRTTLAPRLRHNLPDWIAQPLEAQLGEAGFWVLVEALDRSAPLDLRVNTVKAKRDEVLAALAAAGIEAAVTPWSPWGLRVNGKPALNNLDLFTCGDVEVQDEGSQLLALLTDAKRGEMVVDFCAGAGGKTLALGAAMRNTGRLYAFDVSGHRLEALKQRLGRSGLSNVHPVQIAHERDDRVKRLAGKVDRVLIDAPCSGLGTLRRNPGLKWRQSPEALAQLQTKQSAILASASRLLKPGGRLVYATCSLLRAENETVVDAFSAEHPAFERLDAAALLAGLGICAAESLVEAGNLRLWPHLHSTDGFFASVWRKS
jgi:16S rRNA (cytosine967-C5)-methyltransferase